MQHKLIMENWRKYLSEQQAVMAMPDGEGLGGDDYWVIYKKSLNPRARKDIEDMEAGCYSGEVPGYCRQIEIHKRRALEQNKRRNRRRTDAEKRAAAMATEIWQAIILMYDPTAQIGDVGRDKHGNTKITFSHELLADSYKNFKKDPSMWNGADVAINSLAMIPLIGGFGKLARAGARIT